MGRLSEAIFMANCSPKEWAKYSKTYNKNYMGVAETPFYLSHISRQEAKRLRRLNQKQQQWDQAEYLSSFSFYFLPHKYISYQ